MHVCKPYTTFQRLTEIFLLICDHYCTYSSCSEMKDWVISTQMFSRLGRTTCFSLTILNHSTASTTISLLISLYLRLNSFSHAATLNHVSTWAPANLLQSYRLNTSILYAFRLVLENFNDTVQESTASFANCPKILFLILLTLQLEFHQRLYLFQKNPKKQWLYWSQDDLIFTVLLSYYPRLLNS